MIRLEQIAQARYAGASQSNRTRSARSFEQTAMRSELIAIDNEAPAARA